MRVIQELVGFAFVIMMLVFWTVGVRSVMDWLEERWKRRKSISPADGASSATKSSAAPKAKRQALNQSPGLK